MNTQGRRRPEDQFNSEPITSTGITNNQKKNGFIYELLSGGFLSGLLLPEKLRVASMVVRIAPWESRDRCVITSLHCERYHQSQRSPGQGSESSGSGVWSRTFSFLLALNFFRHSTVSCLCIMEATVERCCKYSQEDSEYTP